MFFIQRKKYLPNKLATQIYVNKNVLKTRHNKWISMSKINICSKFIKEFKITMNIAENNKSMKPNETQTPNKNT